VHAPIDATLSRRNEQIEAAIHGELVSRHWSLINKLIRKFTGASLSRASEESRVAEMQSAGADALWNAARCFDPVRGAFTTYASRAIWNAIRGVGKREAERSKCEVSLDAPISEDGPATLHDTLAGDIQDVPEHDYDLVADCIDDLPARESLLIKQRQDGSTQGAIAVALGVSPQRVSVIERKAIARLTGEVARRSDDRRRPAFLPFVDRPPLASGLPRGATHQREVFPKWWNAQSKRGWPASSVRALGIQE
jgi:RNA polymerase sigma factor (sigma-70 family)